MIIYMYGEDIQRPPESIDGPRGAWITRMTQRVIDSVGENQPEGRSSQQRGVHVRSEVHLHRLQHSKPPLEEHRKAEGRLQADKTPVKRPASAPNLPPPSKKTRPDSDVTQREKKLHTHHRKSYEPHGNSKEAERSATPGSLAAGRTQQHHRHFSAPRDETTGSPAYPVKSYAHAVQNSLEDQLRSSRAQHSSNLTRSAPQVPVSHPIPRPSTLPHPAFRKLPVSVPVSSLSPTITRTQGTNVISPSSTIANVQGADAFLFPTSAHTQRHSARTHSHSVPSYHSLSSTRTNSHSTPSSPSHSSSRTKGPGASFSPPHKSTQTQSHRTPFSPPHTSTRTQSHRTPFSPPHTSTQAPPFFTSTQTQGPGPPLSPSLTSTRAEGTGVPSSPSSTSALCPPSTTNAHIQGPKFPSSLSLTGADIQDPSVPFSPSATSTHTQGLGVPSSPSPTSPRTHGSSVPSCFPPTNTQGSLTGTNFQGPSILSSSSSPGTHTQEPVDPSSSSLTAHTQGPPTGTYTQGPDVPSPPSLAGTDTQGHGVFSPTGTHTKGPSVPSSPSPTGTDTQGPGVPSATDTHTQGPGMPSFPSLTGTHTQGHRLSGSLSPSCTSTNVQGSEKKKGRRLKCRKCPGCLIKKDCGQCPNCKDKPKNGGPGKIHKSCVHRQCHELMKPATTEDKRGNNRRASAGSDPTQRDHFPPQNTSQKCGRKKIDATKACTTLQSPPPITAGTSSSSPGTFAIENTTRMPSTATVVPNTSTGGACLPTPMQMQCQSSETTFPASISEDLKLETAALGDGSFGVVYKAKASGGQVIYAVKKSLRPSYIPKFKSECEDLCEVQHPNLVLCLGIHINSEGVPLLVMELMKKNLTQFLEECQDPVPLHGQIDICLQAGYALRYLHSRKIIHYNLHGKNVLLKGATVKLSDFGVFRRHEDTECYMPPEAFKDPPVKTKCGNVDGKFDVFCLGVLMVQVITRKRPNPTGRDKSISDRHYEQVKEKVRRKDDISNIAKTHPMRTVALECLTDPRDERPGIEKVMSVLHHCQRQPEYMSSVHEEEDMKVKKEEQLREQAAEVQKLRKSLAAKEKTLERQNKKIKRKDANLSTELKNNASLEQQLQQKQEEIEKLQKKVLQQEEAVTSFWQRWKELS